MTNTLKERTEQKAALGAAFGNGSAQNGLRIAEKAYCEKHGLVKAVWGQCELCFDEGLADWDATRIAKLLIPAWTGIKTDGRQVIVARVRDALEAVEKISLYKNSDALVLIVWDTLVTPLENGKIGPSWTLREVSETLDVECARCAQPFTPIDDERVCEECWLAEYGPRR
jgi:hypothetical protein